MLFADSAGHGVTRGRGMPHASAPVVLGLWTVLHNSLLSVIFHNNFMIDPQPRDS